MKKAARWLNLAAFKFAFGLGSIETYPERHENIGFYVRSMHFVPRYVPRFYLCTLHAPEANPQLIARTTRAIFAILSTVAVFVSASMSSK